MEYKTIISPKMQAVAEVLIDAFDHEGLLRRGARTRDEDCVIRHILESYKTVGFGMNSFFHCFVNYN